MTNKRTKRILVGALVWLATVGFCLACWYGFGWLTKVIITLYMWSYG